MNCTTSGWPNCRDSQARQSARQRGQCSPRSCSRLPACACGQRVCTRARCGAAGCAAALAAARGPAANSARGAGDARRGSCGQPRHQPLPQPPRRQRHPGRACGGGSGSSTAPTPGLPPAGACARIRALPAAARAAAAGGASASADAGAAAGMGRAVAWQRRRRRCAWGHHGGRGRPHHQPQVGAAVGVRGVGCRAGVHRRCSAEPLLARRSHCRSPSHPPTDTSPLRLPAHPSRQHIEECMASVREEMNLLANLDGSSGGGERCGRGLGLLLLARATCDGCWACPQNSSPTKMCPASPSRLLQATLSATAPTWRQCSRRSRRRYRSCSCACTRSSSS